LTHRGLRHLRVGVSPVAAGEQTLLTEEALSATDRERHDHPVAHLQSRDGAADLDDLSHVFMAQLVALFHRGLETVEEMEVRAADRRRCDLDDDVARVLDGGVGNRIHPNVAGTVPTERFHRNTPMLVSGTQRDARLKPK
jgi:hypothetical protein